MIPPVERVALWRKPSRDVPTHLERSLDVRWRKYRKAFDRCCRKFSEESVHQLRVETRRLLALVELLDTLVKGKALDTLRCVLKNFFDGFAPLRDAQVQLLFVEKYRERFPRVTPFRDALARRESRLIKKLRKRIKRVGQKRTRKLATSLRRGLDAALTEAGFKARGPAILVRHVDAAFSRVVSSYRRIDRTRAETIHRTRIAFKKFRYLMELLQPLLPGVSRRKLAAMHSYQTLMGEIQDLEVLQAALGKYLKKRPAVARLLMSFRGEIERKHAALVARYLAQADSLLDFWATPSPEDAPSQYLIPTSIAPVADGARRSPAASVS